MIEFLNSRFLQATRRRGSLLFERGGALKVLYLVIRDQQPVEQARRNPNLGVVGGVIGSDAASEVADKVMNWF